MLLVPPAVMSAPAFIARVYPVRRADVRFSYRRGCPVAPPDLRRVRVAYWGFDGSRRLGSLIVNRAVVGDVLVVFRRLYATRFPIRQMLPIDAFRGSDDASMAADNTSGFNCRRAVGSPTGSWSAHAYGEAVDVNPVENPYVLGGRVLPASGRAYRNRERHRRGMAWAGNRVVAAFARVGWKWGGRWSGSPDYQHFSATGR